MAIEHQSKTSYSLFDQVLKLVAVASLLWGIWQYFDKLNMDTKRETATAALRSINEFNGVELQTAYGGVGSFWRQKIDPRLRSGILSKDDQLRVYIYLIQKHPDYRAYDANVLKVLTHLDNMAFCTAASLCDERIVGRFYCDKIRVFMKLTLGDILYYRQEGMNVGKETEEFLEHSCPLSSDHVAVGDGG